MSWQPLSSRGTGAQPEALCEGVPDHLHARPLQWIERNVTPVGVTVLGLQLRLPLKVGPHWETVRDLQRHCTADDEVFLDVLDGILRFDQVPE